MDGKEENKAPEPEHGLKKGEADKSGGTDGGGFMDKLKHAPPWVWIAIALAAGTLIIGLLSYKKQDAATDPNAATTTNAATDPNAATSGQDATGGFGVGAGQDPGGYGGGSSNALADPAIMTAIAQIQSEIQSLISTKTVPVPPPHTGGHSHHHGHSGGGTEEKPGGHGTTSRTDSDHDNDKVEARAHGKGSKHTTRKR